MSEAGATKVRELQQDLACPGCDYNLRGLQGDIVTCPECGVQADVARLVTERWTGPWYRAPGLNRLKAPVACMAAGLFGLAFATEIWGLAGFIVWAVGLLIVWGWLMWRVARLFRNRSLGIALALLEHLLLLGYFVGGVGFIGGLFRIIVWSDDVFSLVRNGLIMAGSAAIIWACRRSERFTAARCIREHLRRAAAMPPHLPES